MLESEAKTKFCPHAKTFGASQQLVDGPGPHCIGSACMAWDAWANQVSVAEHQTDDFERNGWSIDESSNVHSHQRPINMRHEPWGDCGMKFKECEVTP